MDKEIITWADLRINNYYFFAGKIVKLDLRLLYTFCITGDALPETLDALEGIPIIPSMLDMAGFYEHPDKIFIDKSDRIVIRYVDNMILLAVKPAGDRIIMPVNVLTEIVFLHELQSIYHFLKKEELNVIL